MKIMLVMCFSSFATMLTLLYNYPLITLSTTAVFITATILIFRNNKKPSPTIHRFVVKPGLQPGTNNYINATTLAAFYELEPDSYIVYDPKKPLEISDILLLPLKGKYHEFKEQSLEYFYLQQQQSYESLYN